LGKENEKNRPKEERKSSILSRKEKKTLHKMEPQPNNDHFVIPAEELSCVPLRPSQVLDEGTQDLASG